MKVQFSYSVCKLFALFVRYFSSVVGNVGASIHHWAFNISGGGLAVQLLWLAFDLITKTHVHFEEILREFRHIMLEAYDC